MHHILVHISAMLITEVHIRFPTVFEKPAILFLTTGKPSFSLASSTATPAAFRLANFLQS
jgi:hypothetical protein